MRWYADNSELNGIREAEIPDILLFGGIAVSPESEQRLRQEIENVKKRHGAAGLPVKWNFRALESKYSDKIGLYSQLLSTSKQWRKEMLV